MMDSQLLGSLRACVGAVVMFPVQMLKHIYFSKSKKKSKMKLKLKLNMKFKSKKKPLE
jgi:hypothetical protein